MDPPLQPARDVLQHIRNAAAAKRLLEDERARRMTRAGGAFHYLDPLTQRLVRLRGLTAVLQELYWPDYRPWQKKRAASAAANKEQQQQQRPAKRARRGTRESAEAAATAWASENPLLSAARGHVRGSMVHEQLHDALTLDRGSFERRHVGGWHPWARRVLREILARGWFPLTSEHMVTAVEIDPRTRKPRFCLGTAIDLVCVKEDGTVVFIELKTSASAGDFFAATEARMSGALGLSNNACHRAQVQLLAGVTMAVQGLGHREHFEAWVVHVDDARIDFARLSDAFIVDTAPVLWADLRRYFENNG